jgi:cardiolipin synthase A/B
MPGLLIAVALTLFAVILALNFSIGEKKIEQRVERLYAAAGPAILPGNRFEALLNGDRIFPAMLAAIRDARKTITLESYIYW